MDNTNTATTTDPNAAELHYSAEFKRCWNHLEALSTSPEATVAAIASDGHRPTVWGLGTCWETALDDAREFLRDSALVGPTHFTFIDVYD